jgi:RND family efflux transporter MFP subunit
MTVTAGVAAGALEYAAEIRARTESRLAFRVGGKLVERRVDVGAVVGPGQLLARIDPQDLRLGEEAASAAVQAAEVNADLAAAEFQRFRHLFEQGFISKAELERREAALKATRAQAVQARAQSGVQSNQAVYSALVADAGGVVTAVEAEPGAVVGAGTPIVRVALDGPRDAVFAVPEDKVALFRALQGRAGGVQLELWAQRGVPVPATVREIAAAADPVTRTFLVKADVGRAAVALGQTASVRVDIPAQPGVVKLPLTAVMQTQGRSAVWVVDAATMTVKAQPIEVAGADANDVVVSAGLQPGQAVVTAGVHTLTPGQKVRLYGSVAAQAASTASASR